MTRSTIAMTLACALTLLGIQAADAGRPTGPARTAARDAAGRMKPEAGGYRPSNKAWHSLSGVGSKRLRKLVRTMGFATQIKEGPALDVAEQLVHHAAGKGRLPDLEAALTEMADTGRVRSPRLRAKRVARDASRALNGIDKVEPHIAEHRAAIELVAGLGNARMREIARRIGVADRIDTTMAPTHVARALLHEAWGQIKMHVVREALDEIARTGQLTVASPAGDLAAAARAVGRLPHYDRTQPDHRQARDTLAAVGPYRLRQLVQRLGLSNRIYREQAPTFLAGQILEVADVTDVARELSALDDGAPTSGPGLRAAIRRAHQAVAPLRTFDRRRAEHKRIASAVAELGSRHLALLAKDLGIGIKIALERAPERVAPDLLEMASDHGRLDDLKAALANLATER